MNKSCTALCRRSKLIRKNDYSKCAGWIYWIYS
nr:MAG TPA: hypothetical protein [Crassvirales sp.]